MDGNERAYKMKTVVSMTGFSPALLRAWERRHGLLEPRRTTGGHRLYTPEDLRVLEHIRQRLDEGSAIGEIAAQGREAILAAGGVSHQPPPTDAAVRDQLQRWADDLVACARSIDGPRMDRLLDEAFARLSPETVIADVIEPALREIGLGWSRGEISVAGEHLVSARVQTRIQKLIEISNQSAANGALHGVCACLPDEQHQIGALLVAYWLTRNGYRVTYLGPSLPLRDLAMACETLGPRHVFLSVTCASLLEEHLPELRDLIGRFGQRIRFHLGGQGVRGEHAELVAAGAQLASDATGFRALPHP